MENNHQPDEASLRPFHLAIPVSDLEEARKFYVNVMGCRIGRFSSRWIDYDFFGHQLTTHLVDDSASDVSSNEVDGKQVPARHFGIVLGWDRWHQLCDEIKGWQLNFVIEPNIRFEGQPGEQATFFIQDPSGNVLEFKSFRDLSALFDTADFNDGI